MRSAAAVVLVVLGLAATAGSAGAADECRGLLVCVPVPGPWVLVPPAAPGSSAKVEYALACPRGYIVAGTDVRLTHRQLDVSIRGETGSPVAPGVTTDRGVVFTGFYTGPDRRATAYRPYVGCVPATGGGGARAQTSRKQQDPGLKPTRPLERQVANLKLKGAVGAASARCGRASRLVGSAHAVAFRVGAPPGADVLSAVRTQAVVGGDRVTVTVKLGRAAMAAKPELQVQAVCAKVAP